MHLHLQISLIQRPLPCKKIQGHVDLQIKELSSQYVIRHGELRSAQEMASVQF